MVRVLHYPQLSLYGYAQTLQRFNTRVVQLSPGQFRGSITIVGAAGCLLMQCHSNLAALVHGEVPDDVGFYFPLEKVPFFAVNRRFLPDQQLLTAGKSRIATFAPTDSSRLLLCVTRQLIREVLGPDGCDDFLRQVRKIELEGLVCHGKPRVTEVLWHLLHYCVDGSRSTALLDPRAVATAVVKHLAAYISDEHYYADITPTGHDRIIQAALKVLTDQSAQKLNVETLTKRVFTSRRNLSYAFNGVLGISPKRFLKMVHFNEIRERLIHDKHCGDTADVFREYGYTNPARAMREYEELFIEHPSETKSGPNSLE